MDDKWTSFEKSGKIVDYLIYKGMYDENLSTGESNGYYNGKGNSAQGISCI